MATSETPTGTARADAHARALQHELAPAVQILVETLGKTLAATIVGRDVKTIGRWMVGAGPRRDDEKRRVWDALQIVELLRASEASSNSSAWFLGMNPDLDDRSPADLLAEDGHGRRVMAAAQSFANRA